MNLAARFRFPAISLCLFLFFAVVHTWPLASNPNGLSRNDTQDTTLHEWILAWDAHALISDPLNLFNANTPTSYQQNYGVDGTQYLQPLSILSPRVLRLNVTLDF